jgi:hypothetical protein
MPLRYDIAMADTLPIEEIERAIRALSELDIRSVTSDELARAAMASTRLTNVVLALSSAVMAEFQVRGDWAEDGAVSAARWVANRTGEHRGELARRARIGTLLRQVPAVAAATSSGDITFDHARRIAECVQTHPDIAARDEAMLLESARTCDADMFRMVARHWRQCADDLAEPMASDGPERQEHLHVSIMADGWHAVDGTLSPENGAALRSLLDEFVDRAMRAQRDGDPSLEQLVPSALRADALADLVAQHRRCPEPESTISDRYRVAVVVPAGTPLDDLPVACCDSDMFRAVLDEAGEILDIGRTTRAWTTGIRRGVVLRDGGCVFPGCDRPPSWCDVHHCTRWHDGGPTSIDNGALLCRRHHTFIHAKRWRVVISRPRGKPEVLRPDGSRYCIPRM